MPGKIPSKKLIYFLFTEKLDALREYLEMNQRNWFIREFTSLVGYLIIFGRIPDYLYAKEERNTEVIY